MDNESFPSPEALWEKYKRYKGIITPEEEKIVEQGYYEDGSGRKPRYYQQIAINRTVEAIAKGQDRILLVMATGTGKTYTAFQIIYRLWKAKAKKRILFLADRTALIDQTRRGDFKHFKDSMTVVQKRQVNKAYEVYLALYQGLTGSEDASNIYKQFSPDFFDLIVVDECHRGSSRDDSAWREILDYFKAATQIGLTATPKERVVRHTHSALHNALKQAVRWNILQKNVAEFVELPKVPHIERRVLSPDESLAFLDAADSMPHGLIFEFALLSGMRPEEFLALQWSDLDFERFKAQVNRALVRHKGSWTFEKPKTAKSRRIITLSEPLMRKLISHKRKQNETRLKNGLTWENNDLVFCTELGTPHSVPNLTYRYYRPILKKAGLPQIRLYDLRHSHATLLLIAEENPKVVAERLGHSTIVLTMDTYSHVIPTMQRNATDKLTRMLYERPQKRLEKRFGTL